MSTASEHYERLMAMTPEKRREAILAEARERAANAPQPPMIALADCEDRRLYSIHSRNLTVGAFRAETKGFIGIRLKFGSRYLFEEYHWETGPPFGTARPEDVLDVVVPPEITLAEHLRNPDGSLTANTALFEFIERHTIQPSDWLPDNH